METQPSRSLIELTLAQEKALALLAAIESAGIIAPGRSEREIERDVHLIARRDFGVKRHWHQRIVRAGANTLISGSDIPLRTVGEDDIVFLDLGPVFGNWEGDVGQSYAMGTDPEKHRLCRDLPIVFDAIRLRYEAEPAITAANLYDFACSFADSIGWRFAGKIAGHIVGEFRHARVSGDPRHHLISPDNARPMNALDEEGNPQYWIIEVKLAAKDDRFAGFYERLMQTAGATNVPGLTGADAISDT